ncbi:MAG: hypothetical protein Q4B50_04845 [Bacillota bacterium]|nr:hypothetical protein [Bacillota bacterium]
MEAMPARLSALLNQALYLQKRSVRIYEFIARAAPGEKERELLQGIRREERRHYYMLEGIYEELTDQAFHPERVSFSLPRFYQDMLRTALCDKLAAIDFYEDLLQQIHCGKKQVFLQLLIEEQKEHARILAALYDR